MEREEQKKQLQETIREAEEALAKIAAEEEKEARANALTKMRALLPTLLSTINKEDRRPLLIRGSQIGNPVNIPLEDVRKFGYAKSRAVEIEYHAVSQDRGRTFRILPEARLIGSRGHSIFWPPQDGLYNLSVFGQGLIGTSVDQEFATITGGYDTEQYTATVRETAFLLSCG